MNIISAKLNGTDLKTIYLNEGGEADSPTFRKNGNIVFHTWNLDRMDRHLYTQSTADGMMELPVIFGRVQGQNMWGNMVELANRSFIGITGRRIGPQTLFQAFYADHTLGTGFDENFESFTLFDKEVDDQVDIYFPKCSDPPLGRNCFTNRYYGSASYSPDGRALITYNDKKTYYPGDSLYFQTTYGALAEDKASGYDPYLPELQVALIDSRGNVETVLTPPANRSFRYPTWVGKRESPVIQERVTNESLDSAEIHIADFPLWLSMRVPSGANKTNAMNSLDQISTVRVLVKDLGGNACTSDGYPYRNSTLIGANAGMVDHPTHLGMSNATGFIQLAIALEDGGDNYGEIPLEADKSIKLKVPAGKLLLFQGVDEDGYLVAQHSRLFAIPPGHKINTSVKRSQYASQCMSCHGSISPDVPFVGLDRTDELSPGMDFNTLASLNSAIDLTHNSVEERKLTFLHQFRPIIESKCVSCHSGSTPEGELSLEKEYSQTANYPKGKWAAELSFVLSSYLDSIPNDGSRVPGYNWSPARANVLLKSEFAEQFIPDDDPYKPLGDLAPWDSGYQNLFATTNNNPSLGYYFGLGSGTGRGQRQADTSFLMEVLTGGEADDPNKDYVGAYDHSSLLSESEIRILKALIDNGFPYMSRCDDKIVPSGPYAGQAWGDIEESDSN